MQNERKDLALFLLIAFTLPLVCLFFETKLNDTAVCFVLYGIQAASPTIAAAVVLCKNKQAKAFAACSFCQGQLKTAVLLPAAVACTTIPLAKLIFCCLAGAGSMLQGISVQKGVIILWALFAEEAGWRGYLEPALKKRAAHPWAVPGVVGAIWCLWHYHFFLRDPMQLPPLLFLLSCVVESYLYSLLMELSGGRLVSAMVYHFSWNLLANIVGISPAFCGGSAVPYMILVGLEVIVFAALRHIKGKGSLC